VIAVACAAIDRLDMCDGRRRRRIGCADGHCRGEHSKQQHFCRSAHGHNASPFDAEQQGGCRVSRLRSAASSAGREVADLQRKSRLTGGDSPDVGCGSGAATLAAQEAVGVQGVVVGLDISPAMLRRASDGGVARLVHQREYSVTMATGDYLSMLDLFAYGRFLRQHLGPTRWQDFRERRRREGGRPWSEGGRVHQPVSRRGGHKARVAALADQHTIACQAANGRHAVAMISPPGACARSTRSNPLASSRPPTSSAV